LTYSEFFILLSNRYEYIYYELAQDYALSCSCTVS
jgi:hypothetical protein